MAARRRGRPLARAVRGVARAHGLRPARHTEHARHLAQALRLAARDDHATRSRACLVAALAYHHAGRYDLALPWYHATRRHAASEGDDATLSALMHNLAWLRGSHAREASIFGGANADDVRQALMGAESTEHFDAGLGTASLQSLVPMLRAQILVVLGQCEEALAFYAEVLPSALQEGLARMEGFCWPIAHGAAGTSAATTRRSRKRASAETLLGEAIDIDDRAGARPSRAGVRRARR